METWYMRENLQADLALYGEGLVPVQSPVHFVDVSLYLGKGGHAGVTMTAHIVTYLFVGQTPHALRVRRLHFPFPLHRTHARARRPTAATAVSGSRFNHLDAFHAVVVFTVQTLVVLQKLALGLEPHAVAEAAEVRALDLPAVLVGAVSPDGGLLEELLGAVSADKPLEAVSARVAAVAADVPLRAEGVLAHPAHPGALGRRRRLRHYAPPHRGLGRRGRVDSSAGGRLAVGELLGHLAVGEEGVSAVGFRHVRQDVFVPRHLHFALAAVEEEVGEVSSAVEAAHVQAGDRGLSHLFAAHGALVENLVYSQEMIGGCGLL